MDRIRVKEKKNQIKDSSQFGALIIGLMVDFGGGRGGMGEQEFCFRTSVLFWIPFDFLSENAEWEVEPGTRGVLKARNANLRVFLYCWYLKRGNYIKSPKKRIQGERIRGLEIELEELKNLEICQGEKRQHEKVKKKS